MTKKLLRKLSTNIRRRRIYNLHFFVKFLDLLVGFRKFYILKKILYAEKFSVEFRWQILRHVKMGPKLKKLK